MCCLVCLASLPFVLLQDQSVAIPARLIVTCPADVQLVIQGQRMQSTGTERHFDSPPLPSGRTFTYEVQALRRGHVVAARRVDVQAGTSSRLAFTENDLPSAPPGPGDAVTSNFGIDLGQFQTANTQRAELNGRPISTQAAAELVRGDPRLPDPRRPRLTIIGNQQQRQEALALLQGPLRDLAADYAIQDYPPDHWAVAQSGFVTSGQPTIYAQSPDGQVLFRQDDTVDLKRNLEAVRKASPNYQPQNDPDFRRGTAVWDWEAWLPWICTGVAGWFLLQARSSPSRAVGR